MLSFCGRTPNIALPTTATEFNSQSIEVKRQNNDRRSITCVAPYLSDSTSVSQHPAKRKNSHTTTAFFINSLIHEHHVHLSVSQSFYCLQYTEEKQEKTET